MGMKKFQAICIFENTTIDKNVANVVEDQALGSECIQRCVVGNAHEMRWSRPWQCHIYKKWNKQNQVSIEMLILFRFIQIEAFIQQLKWIKLPFLRTRGWLFEWERNAIQSE